MFRKKSYVLDATVFRNFHKHEHYKNRQLQNIKSKTNGIFLKTTWKTFKIN